MWYKWRAKVRTLDANMGNVGGVTVLENIRRYRQLSSAIFQLAQTRYITVQLDELLGYTDSESISTTYTGATVFAPCVPGSLGRDVTVGGEPKILEPLESFLITVGTPSTGSIVTLSTVGTTTTGANLYVSMIADGVLTRGITG